MYFQDNQNKIKRETLGSGWEFIFSSATARGYHGVGFVISPQTVSALEDVTCVSDRILRLKLCGKGQKTYLYSAYASTAVSPPIDRDSFFFQLLSDIQSLSTKDIVVIGMDANAMLVEDQCNKVRFSPNQHPNNNSESLVDLLEGCGLIAVNTRFHKPFKETITFRGPRRRRVTLDYMLARQAHCNEVSNFMTYGMPTVASDYRLLLISMRLKLAATPKAV